MPIKNIELSLIISEGQAINEIDLRQPPRKFVHVCTHDFLIKYEVIIRPGQSFSKLDLVNDFQKKARALKLESLSFTNEGQ